MTYEACTARDFAPFDLDRGPRAPILQALLCAVVLVLSASLGLWIFYSRTEAGPSTWNVPLATPQHAASSTRKARRLAHLAPAIPPLRRDAALLDPTFTSGSRPVAFAQSAPLRSYFQTGGQPSPAIAEAVPRPAAIQTAQIESDEVPEREGPRSADTAVLPPAPAASELVRIPLPTPRPTLLSQVETTPLPAGAGRWLAQQASAPAPAAAGPAAAPNRPGFFESLFGAATTPSSNLLAYAAPEDGGRGGLFGSRPVVGDHQTAIYDISAHTVYLPDGTRLEAHSGLGAALDDPRSVATRMRGATPPNVYDLTPREAPFHGVRALRLTPVGEGTTYGRGGLLAHTFMLGPRGDSNGCVVFRNYQAFLNAYESGQVRRLQVVARMD